MKLRALALLAVLPALPACSDDDDGTAITWRVPCGSHGAWQSATTGYDSRFTYNADKRLIELVMVNEATGQETRHVTHGWRGSDWIWSDGVIEGGSFHVENTYNDDHRVVFYSRTDRTPENGDSGYTITYTYDARGVMTAYDIYFVEGGDIHGTVTGDRTPVTTQVDCLVNNPSFCETWTWEQEDGDPDHWTRGTVDFESDGAVDFQFDRTLDRHFLELTYVETEAGVMTRRVTFDREPDGTDLGHTTELFENGVVVDVYELVNSFSCASARAAEAAEAPATGAPAGAAPPERNLPLSLRLRLGLE